MLNRTLKVCCAFGLSLTILSACSSTNNMEKDRTQHNVDNLSNRLNVLYKKKDNVVKKKGKVGKDGVVNDMESIEMNKRKPNK
ncbi:MULTISPECIES: hypothetical protein [unclassified Bacillus (in: firmicutes)]|uniref:hypothetical protein n=1 Tax=Bacillaceae TaxID=186817 RepID=UPI000BF19608|nr:MULTISPECIES: hypothetical protein [unclassified Bacillus (in: firmicutes)]PEJ47607.1 hypothetical protein CN692_24925 [Bacillus sp. AFS002410]PEL14092.1 hypothetical protein CN601_00670 [Bacillus sp. AFS017336]QKE75524.1 hypothetical protein HPK19_23705 [Arthrobacter citreus]